MPPLLSVREISKSYIAGHGRCWARVKVLSELSLTIARGERVVIAGERGVGKTTLLHCLTGLRRPDAGSVHWDASRGVPYRLCGWPADVGAVGRQAALVAELPDDFPGATAWLQALHARGAAPGGWLVFSARPTPLAAIADRVLTLADGALHPVVATPRGRVAEP